METSSKVYHKCIPTNIPNGKIFLTKPQELPATLYIKINDYTVYDVKTGVIFNYVITDLVDPMVVSYRIKEFCEQNEIEITSIYDYVLSDGTYYAYHHSIRYPNKQVIVHDSAILLKEKRPGGGYRPCKILYVNDPEINTFRLTPIETFVKIVDSETGKLQSTIDELMSSKNTAPYDHSIFSDIPICYLTPGDCFLYHSVPHLLISRTGDSGYTTIMPKGHCTMFPSYSKDDDSIVKKIPFHEFVRILHDLYNIKPVINGRDNVFVLEYENGYKYEAAIQKEVITYIINHLDK